MTSAYFWEYKLPYWLCHISLSAPIFVSHANKKIQHLGLEFHLHWWLNFNPFWSNFSPKLSIFSAIWSVFTPMWEIVHPHDGLILTPCECSDHWQKHCLILLNWVTWQSWYYQKYSLLASLTDTGKPGDVRWQINIAL